MKYFFLFFALVFVNTQLFAQLYCPPVFGDNEAKKMHVTVGGGITFLFGDLDKPRTAGRALYGRFDYTVLRGVDVGIEGQYGTLDAVGDIMDPRDVQNKYFSGGVSVNVYPFEMTASDKPMRVRFGQKVLRGLYVGLGAAYIANDYQLIYRDFGDPGTYGPTDSQDPMLNPIFKKTTSSLLLPQVNTGLSYPLMASIFSRGGYFSLVLNAQFNFANNDYLDGYVPLKDDGTRAGKANDMYQYYTMGVKYSF